MRVFWLVLIVLCLVSPAVAEDAVPEAADLSFAMKAGDVSRYNIKFQVAGTNKLSDDAKPVPIDSIMDITVAVSAGESVKDGSFPIFVNCEKASVTISGQSMLLATSLFPKMTLMLDKNRAITRILPPDPVRSKQPGINYRNFVMLLNPNAPSGPQKVGATWKKTISIPSEIYRYNVNYTLQALEKVNGIDTARIRADISLANTGSQYAVTGFAVGSYSLDGARLEKSHSEITVKTPNPAPETPSGDQPTDSSGEIDAVIKMDMTRVGTSPSIK